MKQERLEVLIQLNKEGFDFSCLDFTISEIMEIISETPLTERDRKIAVARFTRLLTYEELADELNIPIETIRDNVPKIRKALKTTCKRLFVK